MMTRWLRFLALSPVLALAACAEGSASQPAAASVASSPPAASTPAAPVASTPAAPAASTDAGSGQAAIDAQACELLSDADIVEETTWGVDTVEQGPVQGVFENGCNWVLAGGTSGMVPASITLGVMAPGGREYYDTFIVPFMEENGDEPLLNYDNGRSFSAPYIDDGLVGSLSGTAMAVQDDVLVSIQWVDRGGEETSMALEVLSRALFNLSRLSSEAN